MTHELKTFLSDENILELIDTFQFEELYDRATKTFIVNTGELTELLWSVEINPLDHMTVIPNHYLSGLQITSFTIPNSVTSIGNYAFGDCSKLTSISIPNGVTSIGAGAFYNCSSLTSISIGNGVTCIGGAAFYDCSSLKSITLPEGVIEIENYAFDKCSSLTSISIPDSVTSIGIGAFAHCPLTDIYYGGTKAQWRKIMKQRLFQNRGQKIHCKDGVIKVANNW